MDESGSNENSQWKKKAFVKTLSSSQDWRVPGRPKIRGSKSKILGRTTHLCKPSMFTHGLLVPDPLQGSTCLTQLHRSGRQVGSGTERHSGRGGVRLGVFLELLRGYYMVQVVGGKIEWIIYLILDGHECQLGWSAPLGCLSSHLPLFCENPSVKSTRVY